MECPLDEAYRTTIFGSNSEPVRVQPTAMVTPSRFRLIGCRGGEQQCGIKPVPIFLQTQKYSSVEPPQRASEPLSLGSGTPQQQNLCELALSSTSGERLARNGTRRLAIPSQHSLRALPRHSFVEREGLCAMAGKAVVAYSARVLNRKDRCVPPSSKDVEPRVGEFAPQLIHRPGSIPNEGVFASPSERGKLWGGC